MSIYHSFFSFPTWCHFSEKSWGHFVIPLLKIPQRIFIKIINSQPLSISNNIILSCKFAFSIILFHFILFMKKSSECQLFTVWTQHTLPFPSAFKGVIWSSGMSSAPSYHILSFFSHILPCLVFWFCWGGAQHHLHCFSLGMFISLMLSWHLVQTKF